MLEIWWVRHGTTDWNAVRRWQGHTDLPLNEEGRDLARALSVKLRDIPFDECWSSDLRRSSETAQLALPGRAIRLDSRLRELPMGWLEGKTWQEVSQSVRQAVDDWWQAPYDSPFPGGPESLADLTRRVNAWRLERPAKGRIIAVTHGGVMRAVMWNVFGPPTPERQWAMELGNTGIVRIRYGEQCATLVSFNDMSHIESAWNLPSTQNLPGSR